jgi:hypothetical protein
MPHQCALTAIKNKKVLKRAQRSALISTSTAYRTVSHSVLCVLTGNMPIHIKAKLRATIFKNKKLYKNRAEDVYWDLTPTRNSPSLLMNGMSRVSFPLTTVTRSLRRMLISSEKCWYCANFMSLLCVVCNSSLV